MALFNQLIEAQQRFLLQLMAKQGVVGVGVGFKDNAQGELTDELAVITMVEQKKPKEALDKADLVPSELDGAKTDVIEVGKIVAQVNTGSRDSWRPVIPAGVTIGHYLVTAGTFGAIVYDRTTGQPLILSNNHVLANSNDALINDDVLQPAATDGGQRPGDVVAKLDRYMKLLYVGDPYTGGQTLIRTPPSNGGTTPPTTPPPSTEPDGCATLFMNLGNGLGKLNNSQTRLTTTQAAAQAFDPIQATTVEAQATIPENTIDAAAARLLDNGMFSSEIRHIGTISGTKPVTLGMTVRKAGRTTDYTEGTVTVINSVVDVGYTTAAGRKTARFTGQVMTTGMSAGGDSGSLIVDKNSQSAVGLLFAGSGTVTIFTPIELVLNALQVRLTP